MLSLPVAVADSAGFVQDMDASSLTLMTVTDGTGGPFTTAADNPRYTATGASPTPVGLQAIERADGMHVVHDQVMGAPTQLSSVEGSFAFDLGGVATTLRPGDTLYLRLDGANEQYAVNGGRVPGAVVFTDIAVTLPVLAG